MRRLPTGLCIEVVFI